MPQSNKLYRAIIIQKCNDNANMLIENDIDVDIDSKYENKNCKILYASESHNLSHIISSLSDIEKEYVGARHLIDRNIFEKLSKEVLLPYIK